MPTFSCYKLRPVVDGKAVSDFDEYVDFEAHDVIPYGPIVRPTFDAKLFLFATEPREPPWAEFLRSPFDAVAIPSSGSVGALLIVRVSQRAPQFFAFAFGVGGRYLLRDDAWQRAYGLRVALNLVYPRGGPGGSASARLLAVDAKRRAGETVRSRRQASRAVTFEAFELDRLRDVVNAATGRPADPQAWGTRVSGADALTFSAELDFDALGGLCEAIERAHKRTDYREQFGWLDHIQPVTDPDHIERLENEVIQALRQGQTDELDLAPPEIIDWNRVDAFRFHFDGRRKVKRPDIRLVDFLSGLRGENTLLNLDVRFLRARRITALDADGRIAGQWSVWRCLSGDFNVRRDTYVLDEGEFYAVNRDYLQDVNNYVASLSVAGIDLPAAPAGLREQGYNEFAVRASRGEMLLLDRQTVRTSASTTPVEICDILTRSRCLVHVKRHLGSSDLSHLFAQGFVSAELLQDNNDFRRMAQDTVDRVAEDNRFSFFYPRPIITSEFEVVYAIVASWRGRQLAEALPFFSKINLRKTTQDLSSRGYRISCLRVPVTE